MYDVEHTGMYEGPRYFIPGGIDLRVYIPLTEERRTAAREALGISPDAPVAMCVARFAIVKAHGVLPDAWRLVRAKSRAVLVLVGGGTLLEEQGVGGGSAYAGKRFFPGQRQGCAGNFSTRPTSVCCAASAAKVSRARCSNTWRRRCPVAATRVGAVPDLIEDGVHGRLVPPEDAEALAAALKEVLNAHPSNHVGRAAYEKAERDYGYATWAEGHEKLYGKLMTEQHVKHGNLVRPNHTTRRYPPRKATTVNFDKSSLETDEQTVTASRRCRPFVNSAGSTFHGRARK